MRSHKVTATVTLQVTDDLTLKDIGLIVRRALRSYFDAPHNDHSPSSGLLYAHPEILVGGTPVPVASHTND